MLHEKALQLHRERYKKSGDYDINTVTFLIDDIKSLARSISHSEIDLDIDFGKKQK